jgi:anti-anti-sigma regulatory factor
MTSDEAEIPVVRRLDDSGLRLVLAAAPATIDRRIEDWIASNLDMESDPSSTNRWCRLIDGLPAVRRRPKSAEREGSHAAGLGGWSRFRIAYRRGITVVRLVDSALVQQSHLQELGADLMDLIDAGNHRILLNFSALERLGSWIIGAVGSACRGCGAVDGGCLKICGLDPQLAEIFTIVGLDTEIELHPDETTAIESRWPAPSTPRPLPVDILSALLALGELPRLEGGSPAEDVDLVVPEHQHGHERPRMPDRTSRLRPQREVKLHVQVGESPRRSVVVSCSRFTIGRDANCQLRLSSAQVSKQHAVLELRGDRLFLRDLGSTNGTTVNGLRLQGLEEEVHSGDAIRIGPVNLVLAVDPPEAKPPIAGLQVAAAENKEPTELTPHEVPPPPTEELPLLDEPDSAPRIRIDVLEGVLVITPQFSELDDEATLETVRTRLNILLEESTPRRVVINLEFVNHLSRHAIALILSHHLRLDWAGGALRICQAHARIIALLDQVRLTMLVDCFPTLDEAVLAAWPCEPREALAKTRGT